MLNIRAFFLNNLGSWALLIGDYRTAIQRFESLRRIGERRYGANHIRMAPIIYKLAYSYHHSGGADNFRFAFILYARALVIAEGATVSLNHELVGSIAEAMGDWYAQTANYTMAETFYEKCIQNLEAIHGTASTRLLTPIYSRAQSLRQLCRIEEAQALEQWAAWIEEAEARTRVNEHRYFRQYPHY